MTKVLAHYGTKADLSKEASTNSRLVGNFLWFKTLKTCMAVFFNSEMEKAKQTLVDCLLLEVSIDVTTLLYITLL